MRFALLIFASLLLSSCALVTPFENRDHAYIAVEFPRENGRLFIAKIGIIRDRPESPVRFEGTVRSSDNTFVRTFLNGASPFSLEERADGEEVYVSLGGGVGQRNAANVQVFDVDSLRQRLMVTEDSALRDSLLACDPEQKFNSRIVRYLSEEGLQPDQPFDVSFATVPREARVSRDDFRALGWTASNDFVVRLRIETTARIRRDGATIGSFFIRDAQSTYMIYDTSGGVPVCETSRPTIIDNRTPFFSSQVVRGVGGQQLFTIDGSILYGLPTVSAETAAPLFDSGRFRAIYGPFRGP